MSADDLFERLAPPTPSTELRARTLTAATQAMASPPAPELWDRIWRSSTCRLAWASCIILLIAGHLLVSLDERQSDPSRAAAREPELADIAQLIELRLDVEPLSSALAALTTTMPTKTKEPAS